MHDGPPFFHLHKIFYSAAQSQPGRQNIDYLYTFPPKTFRTAERYSHCEAKAFLR